MGHKFILRYYLADLRNTFYISLYFRFSIRIFFFLYLIYITYRPMLSNEIILKPMKTNKVNLNLYYMQKVSKSHFIPTLYHYNQNIMLLKKLNSLN